MYQLFNAELADCFSKARDLLVLYLALVEEIIAPKDQFFKAKLADSFSKTRDFLALMEEIKFRCWRMS